MYTFSKIDRFSSQQSTELFIFHCLINQRVFYNKKKKEKKTNVTWQRKCKSESLENFIRIVVCLCGNVFPLNEECKIMKIYNEKSFIPSELMFFFFVFF